MSDGKSQRFTIPSTEQERQAVAWNDEVLRKAYGVDYSLADIFSDLGLSKKYISTFVGSILGSGPSADGKEGILLTHGRPSDMTAENNIAKPGELVIFLSGVTECYPQLVCKSGFAKSPQEPQSSSTLLAEYLLMKRLRDK